MSTIDAVVTIVAIVAILNLLLTVGIVRRLRNDSKARPSMSNISYPSVMLGTGEAVRGFEAVDYDGNRIGDSAFDGNSTLVGIFAQGCSACSERMPAFLSLADSFHGPRRKVLGVVVGESPRESEYTAQLRAIGRVILEDKPGMPVTKALGVKGYPAFAVVDSGRIVQVSGTLVEHINLQPKP